MSENPTDDDYMYIAHIYSGKVDVLSLVIKNPQGNVITVDKVVRGVQKLVNGETNYDEVILLHGFIDKTKPVIIKLYDASMHKNDIDIDDEFKEHGIPMFWFDITFELYKPITGIVDMDAKILVMEELSNLDHTDALLMLAELIPIVFKYGSFCTHGDIKPDNIMKSLDGNKYYFIDLDDISTKKCLYGYERITYTPLFTSQSQTYVNITTIKQDLIELIGTAFKLLFPDTPIRFITGGKYNILYPLYIVAYNINEHNIGDYDEKLLMKLLIDIIFEKNTDVHSFIKLKRCEINITNEEIYKKFPLKSKMI